MSEQPQCILFSLLYCLTLLMIACWGVCVGVCDCEHVHIWRRLFKNWTAQHLWFTRLNFQSLQHHYLVQSLIYDCSWPSLASYQVVGVSALGVPKILGHSGRTEDIRQRQANTESCGCDEKAESYSSLTVTLHRRSWSKPRLLLHNTQTNSIGGCGIPACNQGRWSSLKGLLESSNVFPCVFLCHAICLRDMPFVFG